MSSPQKILVVVAHPDDEVLGAGATIARHARSGDEVRILFLTNGVDARGVNPSAASERSNSARTAASTLGVTEPQTFDFPDNRLDSVALLDIVQKIEAVLLNYNPCTVITHHEGDLNIDHQLCHRAVITACRPIAGRTVKRIYAMEVPSSTEWSSPASSRQFSPTRFVDAQHTFSMKLAALRAYDQEMRPFPHPRSYQAIEALARWRGAMSGLEMAESFEVVREIEDECR